MQMCVYSACEAVSLMWGFICLFSEIKKKLPIVVCLQKEKNLIAKMLSISLFKSSALFLEKKNFKSENTHLNPPFNTNRKPIS
jgi:hypothetical protein